MCFADLHGHCCTIVDFRKAGRFQLEVVWALGLTCAWDSLIHIAVGLLQVGPGGAFIRVTCQWQPWVHTLLEWLHLLLKPASNLIGLSVDRASMRL